MKDNKFRALRDSDGVPFYFSLEDLHRGDASNLIIAHGTWSQFTGLTDKNGTEIYEGDICQSYSELVRPFDGNRKTGKWRTENRVVEYRAEVGSYCFKGSALSGIRQSGVEKYYTVVGNIYEDSDIELGIIG